MNCGQCKHFSPTDRKNWGECVAPFPAWLFSEEDTGQKNMVWVIEDHPNNYADSCDVFVKAM